MRAITNIIITGGLHTGKSSLVQRLLSYVPDYAGLFCRAVYENQKRVGFGLQKVGDPDIDVFAHTAWQQNRFGPFGLELKPFEDAAVYLKKKVNSGSLFFIIDEIGVFEKEVESFQKAIDALLASKCIVLLVVQKRAEYFWRRMKNRNDVTVFNCDEKNHAVIEIEILQQLEKVADTDGSVRIKIR
jgi:nucleoside-triphosphatase